MTGIRLLAPGRRSWFDARTFGVVGDGTTDDTTAIQAAIDAVGVMGGTLWFPDGDYVLSQAGTRPLTFNSEAAKGYALLLLNLSHVHLKFSAGARLLLDVADGTPHNAITVEGCTNVTIEGVRCEGVNVAGFLTETLYTRAAVLVDDSDHVRVERPWSTDIGHCVAVFQSRDCEVVGGFSKITPGQESGSHFALYACTGSRIADCIGYGGTSDGDIFIFGGGSHNVIENCRAHTYAFGDDTKTIVSTTAQGMGIDSGSDKSAIRGCYVYGYYYGFDIKTDVQHSTVEGCVAEKCKVGIAVRDGEGNQPTLNTAIRGNVIQPNGGNGNATSIGGHTVPVGILVTGRPHGSVAVESNSIANTATTGGVSNFLGILVSSGDTLDRSRKSPILIRGNRISGEQRIGASVGGSDYTMIEVVGALGAELTDVLIEGNGFDPRYGITYSYPVIRADFVHGLTIDGNAFGDKRGSRAIELTSCRQVAVTGNTLDTHHGILTATSCEAVTFANNVTAESISAVPTILLADCTFVTLTGNTYARRTTSFADDVYVSSTGTSDFVVITGNALEIANKGPANFTSLVGANNVTASNAVS